MEVAVKGITWTEIILAIEPGQSKEAPAEKRSVIRNLITKRLKVKHPERSFTTYLTPDNTLRITRTA